MDLTSMLPDPLEKMFYLATNGKATLSRDTNNMIDL